MASAPRARTPDISIVIPTMRRPAALMRAACSALAQETNASFELVIVDNDPEGSAQTAVETLVQSSPIPVRYFHAADPGVANARNLGIASTQGVFIAFLDDDEVAPAGWLAAMLEVQARFDADAVFGPVVARLPDGVKRHRDYLRRFYSRFGPAETCTILDGVGCGCSFLRRDALPARPDPFSRLRNQIGGEDDLLFAEMKAMGARYAWAPDAWVWEDPDPARLTLGYTLQRAFAHGQGPCSAAAARGGARRWPTIALWSGIGGAQVIVHGAAAAVHALTGSPRLGVSLGRMAEGLGKILWFPPFKIGFYGQAGIDRQRRQEAAGLLIPFSNDPPLNPDQDNARHKDLDARAVG